MTSRKRIPFVEISGKYVGAPYGLGGFSRAEGFDCLSLIISVGRDLGINMPTSFGAYDIATYPSIWESDIGKAKMLLLNYILSISKEISISKLFVPDIIMVDNPEEYFFGITAGNGTILSAFTNHGVQVVNMKRLSVRRAFRWVQREQASAK